MQGFYHKSIGYWETTHEVTAKHLASYPEGFWDMPLKPSEHHVLSSNCKNWVAPSVEFLEEIAAKTVRYERDSILKNYVDPIVSNPLRWNGLTTEQQQAVSDYRSALLNMPSHPLFPSNVQWPTKPEGV